MGYYPKHLKSADFDTYVGNSIDECEEFVWRKMDDFKRAYGVPVEKVQHFVNRILGEQERAAFIKRITGELSWYKGDTQI